MDKGSEEDMKKKILFVIESLVCAGAEKSLVTLLNMLDYSKYEVDLQLFSYGGEFEELLPKEVNLLPELPYFSLTKESLKSLLLRRKSKNECKLLYSRIKYSLLLRKRKYSNPEKAVMFWKNTKSCFSKSDKIYDVAIAYAQCVPTFYVVDCVNAKKKYAWVNAVYKPEKSFREFNINYYNEVNKIVCVSDDTDDIFCNHFPELADKTCIIYDINDAKFIEKMADLKSKASREMNFKGLKILTVGRLAPQKGYDIAIKAGKILKSHDIDYKWYILGRGPLEKQLRNQVEGANLTSNFIFLGTRANPYPYFKLSDIYVQTSKFEGFGLAIAEARMLNIPVVTTRFSAVYAQMIDGSNGLVVNVDGESVANGIELLAKDHALYEKICDFQKHEKKGNSEEIQKIYKLLDGEYENE